MDGGLFFGVGCLSGRMASSSVHACAAARHGTACSGSRLLSSPPSLRHSPQALTHAEVVPSGGPEGAASWFRVAVRVLVVGTPLGARCVHACMQGAHAVSHHAAWGCMPQGDTQVVHAIHELCLHADQQHSMQACWTSLPSM